MLPSTCGQAGDDGDVADELDLGLGDIEAGDGELAVAHAVELLGLGEDLAGGGDAEVVLGEQAVHGGDVVGDEGAAPLALEADDLGAFGALVLVMVAALRGGVRKGRCEEGYGQSGKHPGWQPAQHRRTGC